MVIVNFSRTFAEGLFAGLTIQSCVRFPNSHTAKQWVDDVSRLKKEFHSFSYQGPAAS